MIELNGDKSGWQAVLIIAAIAAACGWMVMSMAQCAASYSKDETELRKAEMEKGVIRR